MLWPKENPFGGEEVAIDGDDPQHIAWIYERSLERAAQYNITGVTHRLTQGVVKRIMPAVASTAYVACNQLWFTSCKVLAWAVPTVVPVTKNATERAFLKLIIFHLPLHQTVELLSRDKRLDLCHLKRA